MNRIRLATVVALSLAALAAEPAWADRVDLTAPLGATVGGTVATPGGVTTVGFLVTQGLGRKLVLTVKRAAKTSKLIPDVTVIAPDGTTFDLPSHGGTVSAAGAVTWVGKLTNVPTGLSGLWRLEVRGATGTTGAFSVVLKGADKFKFASSTSTPTTVPQNGKTDVAIEAGENVALTMTVKRGKGSSITPQLEIIDSAGHSIDNLPAVTNTKAGSVTLKGYRLPVFGKYTLRIKGAGGGGGGITYTASSAAAKIKGSIPTADGGAGFDVEPAGDGDLDASHSVITGGQPAFRWVQVSGPAATIANPASSKTTFTAPDADTAIAFQLSVSANGVFGKPVTIPVEVTKKPLADVGNAQSVAVSTAVSLNGSGSIDRGTRALQYTWRQMPNDPATVTLTGAATAAPTFTSPSSAAHALHFGLTVDNGRARSDEDIVTVNVGDASVGVADAGRDQIVPRMASVCLSGLATYTSTGALDVPIQWTQISGPTVTLERATTALPSFTAPRTSADLEFKMTVNGDAATADTCRVHVRDTVANLPANAHGNGPLNAPSGAVAMSAASSTVDPNGDTLRFRWGQMSGPSAPIANPGSSAATATIASGVNAYLFAVQANDGLQYGMPDYVAVRNSGFNAAPIAIAGSDRSANAGIAVTLDGRSSARTDGGSAPLSFQWTQVSGTDWFDFATKQPSFVTTTTAPTIVLPTDVSSITTTRTVLFQLVVNDGAHASLPDVVAVTFTNLPLNGKPTVTASASTASPLVGEVVTLQGTSFDRDGDSMTYKWTQTKGPAVVLSPNDTVIAPQFVAPASGDLGFQLVANDGIENSVPSSVVSVIVDQKPVANIVVSPLSGAPGTNVTIDGSSSIDPDVGQPGTGITYKWSQISGTPVSFTASAPILAFAAPQGAVSFRLIVNDGRQDSDPKTAGFSAALPPSVAPTATRAALPSTIPNPMTAAYGATVTLSANASPSPSTYTYVWRVVSQSFTSPTITLSSTTAQNPTFSVPMPTSAPFGLSPTARFGVTAISADGTQSSGESQVTVNFYASLSDTAQVGSSNTVYAIIGNNCTSCHSGTSKSCPVGSGTGYGLGSKSAFLNNSRSQAPCASSTATLLFGPGNTNTSANSYLFFRLTPAAGSTLRMPQGSSLSTATLNFIQDWIDQGNLDN